MKFLMFVGCLLASSLGFAHASSDEAPNVRMKLESVQRLQRAFYAADALKPGDLKLQRSYSCTTYHIGKEAVVVEQGNENIRLEKFDDREFLINRAENAQFLGFYPMESGLLGTLPISPYYVFLKKLGDGVFIGELFVNADHGSLGRDEILETWPKAVSSKLIRDPHARTYRANAYQICF